MEDIEANEFAAAESPCLTDEEESPVDEMAELPSRTVGSLNVRVIGTEGNTALYDAVLSVCQQADTHVDSYRRIGELMKSQDIKLNMPDKEGYTAVGLAVHHRHRTCVERMLKHSSASCLYLDYYPGDSDQTVREIIIQTYPDLVPLLQAPLMEKLDSSERERKLLAALQHDKYNIFVETLDLTNPNPWYDEPYYSTLLEIACQMKNRKEFVKLLLENCADPNIKNRITGMPLIHATARSGNFEVLELLLTREGIDESVTDNKEWTVLHWWAYISERNQGDMEKLKNCFSYLQKLYYQDLKCSSNSAFSIAVERQFVDRIILMMNSSFFESYYYNRVLESAETSLLEAILDNCFVCKDSEYDGNRMKVTFKLHVLSQMMDFTQDSHHKDLLRHPVLSSFVNLTWKKLKYYFFLDVAFYIMFLLSLTTYIMFSEYFNTPNNIDLTKNTRDLLRFNESVITSSMSYETWYNTSQCLWYILIILLDLLFVREVCQLLIYGLRYIKSLENWLELLLIAVTFTSCSGLVEIVELKRHFFAIAILLGWFELVLLLGRLPFLSVQTEMFKAVSLTFLKFMAGYVILILAFSFSFYVLFKESTKENLFSNPLISVLGGMVMFAGEFNAANLHFSTLPGTSHVIFLLFVVFVTIVLFNLLQGLAVGDTRKVWEKAETLSLDARVKLISDIFDVYFALPSFLTPYTSMTEEKFSLYVNSSNKTGSNEYRPLLRLIAEKREKNKKEKTNENVENWRLVAEKQSALQLQCEEMRQILIRIQTHLNIQES
jgi:ankyrin repeat protein